MKTNICTDTNQYARLLIGTLGDAIKQSENIMKCIPKHLREAEEMRGITEYLNEICLQTMDIKASLEPNNY